MNSKKNSCRGNYKYEEIRYLQLNEYEAILPSFLAKYSKICEQNYEPEIVLFWFL